MKFRCHISVYVLTHVVRNQCLLFLWIRHVFLCEMMEHVTFSCQASVSAQVFLNKALSNEIKLFTAKCTL